MEETLFKLARAITDTGTDTVSSEGGTITYRITSLKRKLVNGKVVSTSTPSCTLNSASVSWAILGGVTVGDGYLDVKINYSKNTGSGSSRSTTLTFAQNGSNNKINLTVTQEAGVTYSGYIKPVSNTLPLGGDKFNTAQILVMAYLKGSDGSKKSETPHVGSAPNWCSVSVASASTPDTYYLSLTALSSNQTGASRSGHIFLTCGDANLSIPVTQIAQKASTFTLSGLPTDTGYYLFGRGARPQNTSSQDQSYLQRLSATSTTTMEIPFYANDSEPGSLIECTTGSLVAVYTKSGATWILEGSFVVPSAGGTVSI